MMKPAVKWSSVGSLVAAAVVVRNILPPEAEGMLRKLLGRLACPTPS
jgi:hypothetical protein